jgi:ribosomal protection tetracycline resistance protein
VTYELDQQVRGTMPHAFFRAVEDTVYEALHEGLRGWQVTDCAVTLTHTGYYPRQSHAHQGFSKSMSSTGSDFRNLTPLVLIAALKQAGTVVCEPIHRFHLGLPTDTLAAAMGLLGRLEAVPETPAINGSWCVVEGDVAAARVHDLRLQLPGKTQGEGVLEVAFDRYEPVAGAPPTRARTDYNPLNREEYLLRIKRGGGLG